jgi:hypothetical protein
MTKTATIVRNVLLAFVLVTIGFALGKAAARRDMVLTGADNPVGAASNAVSAAQGPVRVRVYYAHTTVRCSSCNTIERLGEKVVRARYAAELAAGRVTWDVVDFQKDESFAKRYGVVSSCIVVAREDGGRETVYRTLDEVWTHIRNPASFETYVVGNIDAVLGKGSEAQ